VSQPKLALADYLAAIASEFLKAQAAARLRGVSVMQFAECEIEFAVEVEGAGEAGIEIYVVKLGGSVTKTNTNTVRIKFTKLEGGSPIEAAVDAEGAGGAPIVRQMKRKTGSVKEDDDT
jgi:hypothetical protein